MFCSKCGKEIPYNHSCCFHCGNPVAAPIGKPVFVPHPQKSGCGRILVGVLLIFFGIGIVGGIFGSLAGRNNSSPENTATPVPQDAQAAQQKPVPTTPPLPAKFAGDCGITASAHLQSDRFLNHPHLCISIRNISGKNIAAIQFYAVPYDVYGNDISSSIFSQKRLYTDKLIPAGKGKEITFGPFLDQEMKSVKLYVYSVYFEDGTEWGDREATRSEILRFGKSIHATFQK
ncbi:MAG: hypothetical protein IJN29_10605 [Akkermansia sp.]|nr:hypothetical protein [Akkermansia sp.]